MELQHTTRNIRSTARKLRLITEQIKYMPADKALGVLPLVNKRAAIHVQKALKSAVEAAKDQNFDSQTLKVQRISVDEGSNLKRMIGHSRGRMSMIMKKYSHLNIVLSGEQLGTKKTAKAAKTVAPSETVEEK